MLSYIFAFVILTIVLIGNILGPEITHISMRYYDSILHMLAGAGLGFFILALMSTLKLGRWRTIFDVTVGMLLLGIIWELFEIYFNITGYELWSTMYYFDTVKDLILDVVGAALVAFIIIKK